MHNFRELLVWQRSRELVKDIYKITAEYPQLEKFNLCSQMQRAAVSVPSTIAEGSGRGSDADFARFLDMSMGSSHELETQLFVSFDLGYITQDVLDGFLNDLWQLQKMITGLINKLRGKN